MFKNLVSKEYDIKRLLESIDSKVTNYFSGSPLKDLFVTYVSSDIEEFEHSSLLSYELYYNISTDGSEQYISLNYNIEKRTYTFVTSYGSNKLISSDTTENAVDLLVTEITDILQTSAVKGILNSLSHLNSNLGIIIDVDKLKTIKNEAASLYNYITAIKDWNPS